MIKMMDKIGYSQLDGLHLYDRVLVANHTIMNIISILAILVQTVDDMLLRKVEELTLYIIALEKKNKEQDNLIKQLLYEKESK